jgi:hypothetical protein
MRDSYKALFLVLCWSFAGSFTGSCFDPATPAAWLVQVAALLDRPMDSKTGTDVGLYTILVREGPRVNGAWTALRRLPAALRAVPASAARGRSRWQGPRRVAGSAASAARLVGRGRARGRAGIRVAR